MLFMLVFIESIFTLIDWLIYWIDIKWKNKLKIHYS
jgi:hypothetical protein